MSKIYSTVSSCLTKKADSDPGEKMISSSGGLTHVNQSSVVDPEDVKENDAPELCADKKTDEKIEPQKPAGLMWRMSSGLVSGTSGVLTGAVGYGVGGVKWVAGKGYDAGSAVITTTKTVASKVPVPQRLKTKAKNE